MPRALRVLIEGGLYHVYNRFARGEEVFADPSEAVEFIELLRDLKGRDNFQVFAWSLLPAKRTVSPSPGRGGSAKRTVSPSPTFGAFSLKPR
jgi:hypothetical protein